jgi:hypothetical protein
MSASRFASITSDLLARKGEARPWNEPAKTPLAWRTEPAQKSPPPVEAAPPPPHAWKKCTVRLSPEDYERLGILAVKQGTSRHHLLQDAVEQFFTGVARQYGSSCPCLGRASIKT